MLNVLTDRLRHALQAAQGMLARHQTIEALREDLGACIRNALEFQKVFFDGSLPHNQGPRTRSEALAIKPFTAFDRHAPIRDRALDCLRVVLLGKLSEEEKAYLRDERYIRPVPAKTLEGSDAFQWEHPYVTTDDVDMDIFSGTSLGHVVATEDEAWVDAYISKAFWCD